MPTKFLLRVFVGLALAIPAYSHTGGHGPAPLKTWKNIATGEQFAASFLMARGERVYLEKQGGEVIMISPTALAPADRQFVGMRTERVAALNLERRTGADGASSTIAGLLLAIVIAALVFAGRREFARARISVAAGAIAFLISQYFVETAKLQSRPTVAEYFDSFSTRVRTRWDDRYLYVESNGLPAHSMMTGIRSWQQQVPLPQPYIGDNAWSIPLNPAQAAAPVSARTALFRGAIALAVNGVPIFNALNNRGDDAYAMGELDQWGGHAGRADDYHYHVAPLHLLDTVGARRPIAVALDGYAIYGRVEPDGASVASLDALNGHTYGGSYHYHGTDTYPYINGGMRGQVTIVNDQIEPQPRTQEIRPALTPLNGATITNFTTTDADSWSLEYTVSGQKNYINYSLDELGRYSYEFVSSSGSVRSESHTARRPLIFPRVAKALTGNSGAEYSNLAEFHLAIALLNFSTTPSEVTLTAYDENGGRLTGQGIINPARVQLAGRAQTAKYVHELFGSSIAGRKGWIEATYNNGSIAGFYEVFDNSFNFLSGASAVRWEDASARIMLPVAMRAAADASGREVRTEIDIVNPNNAAASVQVRYWPGYTESATAVAPRSVTRSIPARGKIQVDSQELFSGDLNSYFEVVSDSPVVASEMYLRNKVSGPNVASTLTLTVVNGISAAKAGTATQMTTFLPHVTTATGWFTNVILWDIGNRSDVRFTGMRPSVSFWNAIGTLRQTVNFDVRLGEMRIIDVKESVGANFDGTLSWSPSSGPDHSTQGLLVLEQIGDTAAGPEGEFQAKTFESIVPPIPSSKYVVLSHVAEGSFAPGRAFGSGIAVRDDRAPAAASTDRNQITFSLYSSSGTLLKQRQIELAVGEKYAKTFPETFEGMTLPQFSGFVEIRGTRPFRAFGMYWSINNGRLNAVSMIPPQ